MRYLFPLLLLCGSLNAAVYDLSDFGFVAGGDDNWAAMQDIQATLVDGDSIVDATEGTYHIVMAANPACTLGGLSGITIDTPNATFYTASEESTWDMWRLVQCTNVFIRLKTAGVMAGDVTTYGINGIHLYGTNDTVEVQTISERMHRSVMVGGWELGANLFFGNTNITITSTNTDCRYGVDLRITDGFVVTNDSQGTLANDWAFHRAVYVAGCTNGTVRSWAKDSNVTDSYHIVTSNPAGDHHAGSSNITYYATDSGTTMWTPAYKSRKLAHVGIVSEHPFVTETVSMSDISFILNATTTATLFPSNHLFAVQSVGYGARHVFERIKVGGAWDRADGDDNHYFGKSVAIWVGPHNSTVGSLTHYSAYGSVDIALEDFSDNADSGGISLNITVDDCPVTITGCDTTLTGSQLISFPLIQTYTDLGDCEDPDPEPEPPTPDPPAAGDKAAYDGETWFQGETQ